MNKEPQYEAENRWKLGGTEYIQKLKELFWDSFSENSLLELHKDRYYFHSAIPRTQIIESKRPAINIRYREKIIKDNKEQILHLLWFEWGRHELEIVIGKNDLTQLTQKIGNRWVELQNFKHEKLQKNLIQIFTQNWFEKLVYIEKKRIPYIEYDLNNRKVTISVNTVQWLPHSYLEREIIWPPLEKDQIKEYLKKLEEKILQHLDIEICSPYPEQLLQQKWIYLKD